MRRLPSLVPRAALLAALSAPLLWTAAARAGGLPVPVAGGDVMFQVTSIREARFRDVVRQQYDFSCGSAALATLLTHHYGLATTERATFTAMFESGDKVKIKTVGFSMLDMKRYLTAQRIRSNGYKTSLDRVARTGVPAIVIIDLNGYRHFVVVKGISADEVLVGDPAIGMKVYPREAFAAMVVGDLFFFIIDDVDQGRRHFNREREWLVRHKAPFGTAVSHQELAASTLLLLPGAGEWR